MPEKMSKEEFLKKHPPLTEEQIKQKFLEAKLKKQQYSQDMEELVKNIMGLQEIIEPLIDPETDKILAWIRMPTNEELENYYSLRSTDWDKLNDKEKKKQVDRQYELMATIIVHPNNKPEWWKKKTTPRFTQLFAIKLTAMFESLGVTMENF